MGQVAVTLKIMPENPEVDLEKMKTEISSAVSKLGIELKGIEEKPVAFGLKCLEVLLIMPDAPDQGGTDRIEEAIKNIPGIASVEAGDITLL